jgi:hypothetical protein
VLGGASGLFDLLLCGATGQDTSGPRHKVRIGLLAGLVGGLGGAGLALVCRAAWGGTFANKPPEQLWSPDAWGAAALGASLAASAALAQVVARRAWLEVEGGSRAGCAVLLSRPLVTLGRGEQCDVGLHGDRRAESLHARLEQHGRRYLLVDAGSLGGTFVNGQRIAAPHILRAGDRIQVGDSVLKYLERRALPRDSE